MSATRFNKSDVQISITEDPMGLDQIKETLNQTTRQRDEELAKIEMGLLVCIFLATLIGNAIVVLGIYFRRQKMSRMYYFILHLSLADFITAFFNVGTQFVMELTFPSFLGPNALCKMVKFTQILGPYSSSYVLVMTALDRYQAICFPLTNCNWTPRQSKIMLGIAWAISILFCIPQLFIFSVQEIEGYPDCWASFPPGGQQVYVTWYAISFFIVPLLVLVFAYTWICRTIWTNFSLKTAAVSAQQQRYDTPSPPGVKPGDQFEGEEPLSKKQLEVSWRNKSAAGVESNGVTTKVEDSFTVISTGRDNVNGMVFQVSKPFRWPSSKEKRILSSSAGNGKLTEAQPRSSSVKGISRAKIKTVKLTVTVICCYIFCSSPFITAQLWVTFDPNAYQSKFYTGTTFTILTLLASLNSCVNPWIFLFFNPNLLQDFLRGMRCTSGDLRRRRNSNGSPVTHKTSPGFLSRGHPSSLKHRQRNGFQMKRHSNTRFASVKTEMPRNFRSSTTSSSTSSQKEYVPQNRPSI